MLNDNAAKLGFKKLIVVHKKQIVIVNIFEVKLLRICLLVN